MDRGHDFVRPASILLDDVDVHERLQQVLVVRGSFDRRPLVLRRFLVSSFFDRRWSVDEAGGFEARAGSGRRWRL
jgi:hypothetical protein